MAALVGYPRLPMKNFTFFVAQWNRGEKNLGECCRCASSWKNHLGTLQQVDDGQIVISSWNMIFTYTLPLKKNFEDRRNRGDIGWDGPRLPFFPVAFRISLYWSGVAAKRGWVLLGDDNFLHEKMSANMEDLNQESPDIVLLDSRTPLVLYHKVRSWEVWLIQHQLPKPCHLIPGLHMCSADASATSDALQCWCTWHAGPGITTQLWEAEGHCNYLFFFNCPQSFEDASAFELAPPWN